VRNGIRFVLFALICALAAAGQTFSSGSTGADGALDLTAGNVVVQLPDSGILNYTTVNIPSGRVLTFGLNTRNTPVVMLAQGAVMVSGEIGIGGSNRTPGPGGFYGGATSGPSPGFGPAGGAAGNPQSAGPDGTGQPGQWVGPLSLVPNIGGSGGGASPAGLCYPEPADGGGGGGAITIASSTSITVGGLIDARASKFGCGGAGAAGAIRLVSNSINVVGSLYASVVRLEAPLNALTYNGAGTAPVGSTINPTIVPTNPPALSIVSIGGYPVPSYSGSSFSTIDVLLPTQLQDPIPVVVQATNVPVGSPVSIAFSGPGAATSTTATLTGTTASSTAIVYVSGVSRSGVSYLFASSTFSASLIAGNLNSANPEGLSKVELAAAPGQKTNYRFLRNDGSEISAAKVPEDVRRLFGL
jgi:hypothetical protein